jgi:hypothetical protein
MIRPERLLRVAGFAFRALAGIEESETAAYL